MKQPQLVRASLMMLGGVVGAGVFAVPAMMQRAGILAGSIVFWAMALFILAVHLMYADIVIERRGMVHHRLPGQAREILGPIGGWIAALSHPGQVLGATLAYLILAGGFLSALAAGVGLPSAVLGWQAVFWGAVIVTSLFGLAFVARIDSVMGWLLVGLLTVSGAWFLAQAPAQAFFVTHWTSLLGPIGVFVFALFGLTTIPEVAEVCQGNPHAVRRAVAFGSLGAALLVWLFGVSAAALSTVDLSDPTRLGALLPHAWFWLIPLLGFVAVSIACLTQVQELSLMFHDDARLPTWAAQAITLISPPLLLFFITDNFIQIISFLGSLLVAANALLVAAMAFKLFRGSPRHRLAAVACAVVFLSLIVWRIITL